MSTQKWFERNWRWVMGASATIGLTLYAVLLVSVHSLAVALGFS